MRPGALDDLWGACPIPVLVKYHEATKHHPSKYAPGPGRLDWATQPNPFRTYEGTSYVPLRYDPARETPAYDELFSPEKSLVPRPADLDFVSRLFASSLAVSAWKQAGASTWALRVNPSSGNLHPTEGYLLCGPVEGMNEKPCVFHYAPRDHRLERRACIPPDAWQALVRGLPVGSMLVGLSSIHWREAWKYGSRAFRYCHHDVGHAIAALVLSAASLGWRSRLLDGLSTDDLEAVLGTVHGGGEGLEREHPDCLLAIYPHTDSVSSMELVPGEIKRSESWRWEGRANRLSPKQVRWSLIDEVAELTRKPTTVPAMFPAFHGPEPRASSLEAAPFDSLVRTRRSAVAMDGTTHIDKDTFLAMLDRVMPRTLPFACLPWEPYVSLVLFVHRVHGMIPGIYLLVRSSRHESSLRAAMDLSFDFAPTEYYQRGLGLLSLAEAECTTLSMRLSCMQEIAGSGCFGVAMLSSFGEVLEKEGTWKYPRLFWECGMIGQMLYLEAEAAKMRGTGIGCYFDDATHEVLGMRGDAFQDLYHFTVGGALHDPRVRDFPPYPSRDR